jgi:RNA polymerase sigma-70 factor (ECF subfamily)
LSVWLIGIARHWALRYLRDEGRRRARSLAAALAAWKEEQIQSDAPIDDEVEALKACMQSLPEESARIITEHYYKGQSAVSIARALGKKESAVRMTLLRIRQALRKCVEGKLAAEGA